MWRFWSRQYIIISLLSHMYNVQCTIVRAYDTATIHRWIWLNKALTPHLKEELQNCKWAFPECVCKLILISMVNVASGRPHNKKSFGGKIKSWFSCFFNLFPIFMGSCLYLESKKDFWRENEILIFLFFYFFPIFMAFYLNWWRE